MKYLLIIALLFPISASATVTDYFTSGAEDTYIDKLGGTWAESHDATSGGATAYAADLFFDGEEYAAGAFYVIRSFTPIDTSAIGTDNITAAEFYMMPSTVNGIDAAALVQSTQGSPTAPVVGDFDALGTTEGTDVRVTSFTVDSYFHWTLNATGIGWINKTGYTLLAERNDYDIDNIDPPVARNYAVIYSSEDGSTKEPFLRVTHAAGGGGATPAPDDGFIMFE